MSSPAAPSGAGGSQRTTWAVPRHGSPGTGPASSGSSTVTGSAGCGCARASRPSAALTTWAQVTISLLPTSAPTPTAPPAGPRNRTMNVSGAASGTVAAAAYPCRGAGLRLPPGQRHGEVDLGGALRHHDTGLGAQHDPELDNHL